MAAQATAREAAQGRLSLSEALRLSREANAAADEEISKLRGQVSATEAKAKQAERQARYWERRANLLKAQGGGGVDANSDADDANDEPQQPQGGFGKFLVDISTVFAILAGGLGLWLRHTAHKLYENGEPTVLARWLLALLAALAISTLLPSLLWLLSLALVSLSGSGRPLEVTPVLALSSLLMLCMIGAYVLYWCEMALGSSWLYHVTAGKCHRWLYLLFWKGEEEEPRHERLPESAPDVAASRTSPTRKLDFSPESHQTSLMGSFDV